MAAPLLRRALWVPPLLLGVLSLVFVLLELAPGDFCDTLIDPEMDPATIAGLRGAYGCDRPLLGRWLATVGSLARGDMGVSLSWHRPVADVILEALPNTLVLAGVTLAVSMGAGAAIGVVQAVRFRRAADVVLSVVTLLIWSIPGFWLAVLLLRAFTLWWPILPSSGMVDLVRYDTLSPSGKLLDRLAHLVLPGVAMGLAGSAVEARFMRASMLEALGADWVRTARAKGLPEHVVVLRHAGRNAILPMITLLGLGLPGLFSGSVLVELIFSWPGMGQVIVGAIRSQDAPLVAGCFTVYTVLVVLGGLLADVLQAWVDPRVSVR